MKWILDIALLGALLFVGCSSHAPSASCFMAAKPNSISYGFGGGGFLGDDNSHTEREFNGDVYKYSELRFLLDGVVFFRMDNFVFGLELGEHSLVRMTFGFSNDYLGVQGWISPLYLNENESTN